MRVAPVSSTAYSYLLEAALRIKQPKGTVLFRRGEPALGVFLVTKGSIGLRLEDERGRAIWKRTAARDSIIGLPGTLAGGRYSLTAVTQDESELAFVGRQALIGLIQGNPGLGLELMGALGEEVLNIRSRLASGRYRDMSKGRHHVKSAASE